MTYSLEITETAERFLKKMDSKNRTFLLHKLNSIRDDPFSHLKHLSGAKLWRLRIGDYREILDILISGRRITVVRIDHSKNVYD